MNIRKNYPKNIRKKAASLRMNGKSYKEIADNIKVSKSTARLWCGNIILKPEHKNKLYNKRIKKLNNGPSSSHERRKREIERIIANAQQDIKTPINNQAYQLFGAALYWAEGNKKKHFAITNSDPLLIKFMVNWLHDILDIGPENIKAYLNIHSGQEGKEMIKFWSSLTGIPIKNFGKIYIKPKNKSYKKNDLYYGTIKIIVNRGTDLRIRVFAWISSILKNITPEVDKIERKWYRLKSNYMRC
jgi:hypothetical protein